MLHLIAVKPDEREAFTREVQKAFQEGFEAQFGKSEAAILPTRDVEESFASQGAQAYFAVRNGQRVGGVLVVINEETQFNSLHLLYVQSAAQSRGAGRAIWQAIEALYPETRVWETHTPYHDKRNIHFYVNRCGFKVVEFYNAFHSDPHQQGEQVGGLPADKGQDFFRFEKEMN